MTRRTLLVLSLLLLPGLAPRPALASDCQPAVEACDGVDNDCDGQVDEAEVCREANSAACCTPLTQARACVGRDCGSVPDGCGATLTCGACASPRTCGGGGVANVCGCTPLPLARACEGKSCGSVPDGCAGSLDCGSCAGPATCGGGGVPNVCGCTRLGRLEACGERECGTVADGCGGTWHCGRCGSGAVCKAGVCWDGYIPRGDSRWEP